MSEAPRTDSVICPGCSHQFVAVPMDWQEENARLRAELEACVQVIRGWHGMGMDKDLEQRMWEIYWNDSPEMKRLQAALAARGKEKPIG